MADRDEKDLEKVAQRVEAAHGYLHIDERAAELAKLDEEIAQPGFWDDASHAQSVSKQASVLRDTIAEYDEAAALLDDARAAFDLASEDELFAEEASAALDKLDELLDALEISSWFSERFDGGDAILTVNPGSGGLEAQDWTDMLYRMYVRYAEKKDWKVTVLDVVPGEGIGLDKATIQLEGRNAFGMLKSASGVHRLVRISPTDDKKRRHTTFAGVEVLPVLPDDIEVDLNPADVRVDVYRSSACPSPNRRAASTRAPSACSSCPRSRMTTRSSSTRATCASTSTAPAAPAASASTPPTRPCALRTSPRTSW